MENNESAHNKLLLKPAYLQNPNYLRSISQAVIITDLDGKINFWNNSAVEIYGWSAEEALGRNIVDLVPSQQTKEQAIEIMKLLLQGQSWNGEIVVQRKNGECFPAFVTDLPYYNDQKTLSGLIGISTDISSQKKSEREIQLLLDNSEESFILLDPQLNISSFNKQAFKLYKKHMHRELTKGLPIFQFADLDRIDQLKKDYAKVLKGNIYQTELTFTNKEGIESLFGMKYTPARDESENIIGIFISAKEITEQKQAEAALIANEARWQALIENVHDI